jgi:hypothetical protein
MLRLLVLVALAILVWLLLEAFLRRLRTALRDVARRAQTGPGPGGAPRSLDRLVPCAACGVRVPARRALTAPGHPDRLYCSEECRRAAARAAS